MLDRTCGARRPELLCLGFGPRIDVASREAPISVALEPAARGRVPEAGNATAKPAPDTPKPSGRATARRVLRSHPGDAPPVAAES